MICILQLFYVIVQQNLSNTINRHKLSLMFYQFNLLDKAKLKLYIMPVVFYSSYMVFPFGS
jgi:hypothetical protein